jgi:dTDP-4-dehydrorhamnose 3,5-epimerase
MNPVRLIQQKRFKDARGWFSETYSERAFNALDIGVSFVQDNHSFSEAPLTLRGLHFQAPPHAQAKLVRCVRGKILDIAVDIRKGSPTFGQWVAAELSAENGAQFFVPVGFAHGFLTCEPNTEVIYKVSDFYAPETEGGVIWNDPDLAIAWRLPSHAAPLLSAKDEKLRSLRDLGTPFAYDGHPLQPL